MPGAAHAALIERLGGAAYYDDVLDITWLTDANLAASNTFGVSGINPDGSMFWDTASAWIAGMNAANHLGFGDWRLPSAFNQDGTDPCSGENCNSSEMGYMFYENFDVSAGSPVTTSTDPNFALFDNVQSFNGESLYYWSGSEFAPSPSNAWVFGFGDGFQSPFGKDFELFAWAVRSGDVGAAAAVPEPATAVLLGASLIGFAAARRRTRRPGASAH